MLNTLRHLLPDSTAWRLVVERTLKKYLRGVATVGSDVVSFVDDVYDDLWPDLTRELDEWLDQFGIDPRRWANDDDMRAYLDFRWGEDRGQSPKHLQDKLQAAGFTAAYVYDSFDLHDLTLSTFTGDETGDIEATLSSPSGFSFGNGGRYLYVTEESSDVIHQYELSSPYDLNSWIPVPLNTLDVTADGATQPTHTHLTDDGATMIVLDVGTDKFYKYTLSVNWDVSSGTFVESSATFSAKESTAYSMYWALEGTRAFITGSGSDQVHRYDFSTAWDLSSMSFVESYDPSVTNATGLGFTDDGTVMLVCQLTNTLVKQYDLATAFDLSSVTAGSTLETSSVVNGNVRSCWIESNLLFVQGTTDKAIHKYRFGAWRDPLTYADQPLRGNTQCGETGASSLQSIPQCGEEPSSPISQSSLDSAVCNQFLANEVWYLVNDTLTNDAPPSIPTDDSLWGPFWYVGGEQIDFLLDLDEYDRQRFEKLCLKHGPAETWIVTMLRLWRTTLIGTWTYESVGDALDSGEWQFTAATTSPVKIHDIDDDGVDQSATLATFANGDRIRFEKTNGEWIEYAVTGTAVDNTTYYHVPIYSTEAADESSDWSGFIGQFQIYFREQV